MERLAADVAVGTECVACHPHPHRLLALTHPQAEPGSRALAPRRPPLHADAGGAGLGGPRHPDGAECSEERWVAVDEATDKPGDLGTDLRRHRRHQIALAGGQSPPQPEALTRPLPLRPVTSVPPGEHVAELVQGGPGNLDKRLLPGGGDLDDLDGADTVRPRLVVAHAAVTAVTRAVDQLGGEDSLCL